MLLRLLFILVTCAACAVAPPALRVASDLDNLPFAGVDEAGHAIGRDVEMMQALAEHLGRELVWVRMPFDELLATVEAGGVDAVCATLGITPERAARVAFTRPYFRTSIAVVVRTGAGQPTSLAELAGLRVSGASGTTAARAVLARLPDALAITQNKSESSTAERLLAGELDAAALDGPAADALVAQAGGRLARLGEDLDTEDYAIVVPLGRVELLRRLDGALAELERSGGLDALNERYGL